MKTKFKLFTFLLTLSFIFILGGATIYAQDLPNTNLKYLQRGQEVKDVQIALNKLGYNLIADGSYGPSTKAAVLSFQKKYPSLSNDGMYGPKTRAVMIEALNGKNNTDDPDPVPEPSNINLPNRNLRYFEKGQDVKNVQTALKKLGYNISIDGSYGPGTKSAILNFQKGYSSLTNDGMYGPKTRVFMIEALNGKNNTDDPDPVPKPSTTTRIETRGLVFNIGKSSDQIGLLKDFFRARNESNVPWGYDYDIRTKELVRNYQRSTGLQVDGLAGPLTLDRINKEINEMNFKIGLRIPHINNKGDMIIINKSSNTIYFIKNGVIQNSYPVATGKTESLTPNGQFSIVVKFKNPYWAGAGISNPIAGGAPNNPLGTRWIGISYKGGRTYGVHGNSQPSSIGTYASLGCVRMFNKDVETLYEKVNMNIPIWIGNESLLESYGVQLK